MSILLALSILVNLFLVLFAIFLSNELDHFKGYESNLKKALQDMSKELWEARRKKTKRIK